MAEADPKIIDELKQCSEQGLTFYEAKQELLDQGYQEEAIDQANDQYQYGEKPKQPDPATADFTKDPEDTGLVAQAMLEDYKKERETKAIADGMAGDASPDMQSRIKYQNEYLYDIGMSWWVWLIIECSIMGAILLLQLPPFLYGLIIIPVIIILAIKRA